MEAIKISGNTVETREAFFITFYRKVFPVVSKYVSGMGGTFDETKDVFQDALIIFYEKIVAGNHTAIGGNGNAYLFGIAKHLWLQKYRKKSFDVSLDNIHQDILNEDQDSKLLAAKLMHYLEASGQKCMEILKSFYYDKLSGQQLADRFGFTSIRSATVQKYKCLEKVRDHVQQKSLTYEDFFE